MDTAVHFSSATDDWETPIDFFRQYDEVYHFTLDVCASEKNAKCARYFTKEQDGLKQDWGNEVCWMNPPYGDPEHPCKKDKAGNYKCSKKRCVKRGFHIDVYVPGIIDFMKKAYESSLAGATVVCLVPSRTCTEWWHEYSMKGKIEFIRGRLTFGNAENCAPFPSAVVVFGGVT